MGINLGKIIAGIGTLIAVYLVLSRPNDTATVINTMASNAISGIKTLQGR